MLCLVIADKKLGVDLYDGADREFLIEDQVNHTAEMVCLVYNSTLLGHGMAWLDWRTNIGYINWPTAENGSKCGQTLVIEELFRLLGRKGAG